MFHHLVYYANKSLGGREGGLENGVKYKTEFQAFLVFYFSKF